MKCPECGYEEKPKEKKEKSEKEKPMEKGDRAKEMAAMMKKGK